MTAGITLYAAKRGLIDALSTMLGDDYQVEYGFPANPQRQLIYLGAARLTRTQALAEWSQAVSESCVADIWLRVSDPAGDVRTSEQTIEGMAARVIEALYGNSDLGDGLRFADITAAVAPETVIAPAPESTVTVRLQMQATVRAVLGA